MKDHREPCFGARCDRPAAVLMRSASGSIRAMCAVCAEAMAKSVYAWEYAETPTGDDTEAETWD